MSEEIKDQQPEEAAEHGADETSFADKVKAKLNGRRWPVVVGIIVVVVVVAGAGFGVWHSQPSFCSAICHTPMDKYVNGYYNDETALAYQHGHVDGSNTLAASTLKEGVSDSSIACLDCHQPKMDEQLTEAIAWVGGDYTVDQDGGPVLATPHYQATKEFCTQCHDYEKVVAATEHYWGEDEPANPHASHQGEQDCSSCHNVHGTSTLMCSSCHNFAVPEGWQTVSEAQAAQQASSN